MLLHLFQGLAGETSVIPLKIGYRRYLHRVPPGYLPGDALLPQFAEEGIEIGIGGKLLHEGEAELPADGCHLQRDEIGRAILGAQQGQSLLCDPSFRECVFSVFSLFSFCLQACCGNPLVDARADTEESYTCSADAKCDLCTFITLEGRHRTVGLRNVHGLHNQQIVVK